MQQVSEGDKTALSVEPEEKQDEQPNQDLEAQLPVPPDVAKRNRMRLKAANSVLAFSKQTHGTRKTGEDSQEADEPEDDQQGRIKESEICEQLVDLGIEPLELDSLVPPGFHCVPLQVDVENIVLKALVANKKQEKD